MDSSKTDRDLTAASAPPAPELVPTHPLHDLIDQWFVRHIHNSVVARDTETFNYVHAAKEDLKRLLAPAPAAEKETSDD